MSGITEYLLGRHRLTVNDYHRMGEAGILHEDSRVELIEGELIDMTPIGSGHAGTVCKPAQQIAGTCGWGLCHCLDCEPIYSRRPFGASA